MKQAWGNNTGSTLSSKSYDKLLTPQDMTAIINAINNKQTTSNKFNGTQIENYLHNLMHRLNLNEDLTNFISQIIQLLNTNSCADYTALTSQMINGVDLLTILRNKYNATDTNDNDKTIINFILYRITNCEPRTKDISVNHHL
jgi:hypothetical protein